MSETPPRRPATYADLEAIPPELIAEIVAGRRVVSPHPSIPQGLATTGLRVELAGVARRSQRERDGWLVVYAPELHLGGDVLVPDLAGWRRERLPESLDVPAMTIAPDWLCEVLAPATAVHDRTAKLPAYAREGVRHVWLVDPSSRTLEVLRLDGEHYALLSEHQGFATVHAEPFAEQAVELRFMWEA